MSPTSIKQSLARRSNPVRRWLARRLEAWAADERLAAFAIRFQKSVSRYEALARTYIASGRPVLAINLLLAAPKSVRRATSVVFLLEKACRDANDQLRALSVLTSARADHPSEPKILIRLSDLYRDDAQLDQAHALLLAAGSLGSDEPFRRLAIETAAKNYAAGREILRELMAREGTSLLRAAPVVNGFADRYPELAPEIGRFRAVVRDAVQSDTGVWSPSDRVRLALSCRMIDEARYIHDDAVARGLPLRGQAVSFYKAIKEQAESVSLLARLAWENERGNGRRVAALASGQSIAIDAASCDPAKIVEVFVPAAFYEPMAPVIVRQVFHAFVHLLTERRDIILVPRHQFGFRDCRPLLRGKTLSYHTRGEADGLRHLRFKDGALLGYITLDHCGYAGFAGVATDFDEVRRAVANVPREALYENRAALYAELVETGTSKLPQPATVADVTGRYVFVALQVVNDEVAEVQWMSSIELLRHVARLYSATNIAVVVKRHPQCRSFSVQAAMLELESKGMIIVSNASIHSLISGAEAVFTANSGVGLEALIHGRPVIVSGLCDYAYAAACVRNVEELAAAIADVGRDTMKGVEFLYYYTHRHAFKLSETTRFAQRIDEWLDHPLAQDASLPA